MQTPAVGPKPSKPASIRRTSTLSALRKVKMSPSLERIIRTQESGDARAELFKRLLTLVKVKHSSGEVHFSLDLDQAYTLFDLAKSETIREMHQQGLPQYQINQVIASMESGFSAVEDLLKKPEARKVLDALVFSFPAELCASGVQITFSKQAALKSIIAIIKHPNFAPYIELMKQQSIEVYQKYLEAIGRLEAEMHNPDPTLKITMPLEGDSLLFTEEFARLVF